MGDGGNGGGPLQLRMGWLRNLDETVSFEVDNQIAYVNFAVVLGTSKSEWKQRFETILRDIAARVDGRPLVVNTSPQFLNTALLPELSADFGLREIDNLLDCITVFLSLTYKLHKSIFSVEPFPLYDIQKHPALVRTGIVELRVTEAYLRDPDRLRQALTSVLAKLDDQPAMYAAPKSRSWCTADDFEGSLRKLMTNAGFYVSSDPQAAWRALEGWCQRYLDAIRRSHLASHTGTYLFALATQRRLWEKFQTRFSYVWHPDAFAVYEQIKGKRVLFVSPLAHLADEQYRSGRLWRLYKSRTVPSFELATAPAFISTWPNRPHSDWLETFAHFCLEIDRQAQAQPFDVLVSSCGCYGLPLADYVRQKYGVAVLYLGNIANAFFGVLQNATVDFMKPQQNPEAFVRGDLMRYPNVDLIDDGRYV